MGIVPSPEPLLLTMTPFVIGLLLMLRWPRVGTVWLGVSSLGLLLFSAPFLADALAHPESLADFIPLVVFTVSLLVGTVAAIPSFRKGRGPDAASGLPGAIAVGAGALIVAASLVAVVAFVQTESVSAQAGDVRVEIEDFRSVRPRSTPGPGRSRYMSPTGTRPATPSPSMSWESISTYRPTAARGSASRRRAREPTASTAVPTDRTWKASWWCVDGPESGIAFGRILPSQPPDE